MAHNIMITPISGYGMDKMLPDGVDVNITTIGDVIPEPGYFTTLSSTGAFTPGGDVTLANGKALKTDTTTAHTAKIQAYDVDGAAYSTFATLTNGNTPSLAIAAPSGGTVAIDGATIGATTAAAATVTTITAKNTTNQVVLGTTNTTTITSVAPAASRVYTIADALGSDTFTMNAAAQTLTNKTINGAIYSTDNAVCSATVSRTSSTVLTNVTGMVVTVVPGTYKFRVDAPCVSTANTGISAGFKLTTAVISSCAVTGTGLTAAASVTLAVNTTTADQTLYFDSAADVVLKMQIDGTMVIGTGGTLQFQVAQHTSHADTVSVYAGASMTFTRIA